MKSVIEIGHTAYVLPADDALKVLKIMANAVRVEKVYGGGFAKHAFGIKDDDYRSHWAVKSRNAESLSAEIVTDDRIHIPADLAADPGTEIVPAPTRRGHKLRAHRQQLLLEGGR